MPSTPIRNCRLVVVALAAAFCAASCSQTETTEVEPATYYSQEAISSARQLLTEGYTLLREDSLDAALAKFRQIGTYLDSGVQEYHIASAYGWTGHVEEAFANLNSLVDRGYDKPANLRNDSDFESLRSDSRFDGLVARAENNYAFGTAQLIKGIPVYDPPPITFATEEELDRWTEEQMERLRSQRSIWTNSTLLRETVDLLAKKLAALNALKSGDPEYDAGLERVRAIAHTKAPWDKSWGAVSALLVHEAERYLGNHPSEEGAWEANYRAGFALSLKYGKDSPKRTEAYRTAAGFFGKVGEGSVFYAASQGMILANDLRTPGADETKAGTDMKTLIERFPDDDYLYLVIAYETEGGAAKYHWPVSLTAADLEGRDVLLSQYRGKAVLIDFWATWCSSCRAEIPNLVDIYDRYHDQGLEVLSISFDTQDRISTEDYRRWVDSAGMIWRHCYDGNAWDSPAAKRFFVGSIPAPFLIGPDGSLAAMGDDLRGDNLEVTVRNTLGI